MFSKDSTDLGRTPLLTMDIDMGDHPPVTQRPYSLALKHVEWVREEIEKLEQAGVDLKEYVSLGKPYCDSSQENCTRGTT